MKTSSITFIIWIIFVVLIITGHCSAQEISFSGWGSAGYLIHKDNLQNGSNQETYFQGKFLTDIKLNEKIEAYLDLRGNSADNSVTFKEFSAKLRLFEYLKFRIGQTKKPFSYQYLMQREKLITVNRSLLVEKIGELGYGGRSVSIVAYYNYNKAKPDLPISYYLSIYKNNSPYSGIVTRLEYYIDDEISLGGNFQIQFKGGDDKITTHGLGADIEINTMNSNLVMEFFLVQDPVEGLIRKALGKSANVYIAGGTLTSAHRFHLDSEVIKILEPLIMLSYMIPDINRTDRNTIQVLAGMNVYIHEDVRFRFNADLRLTKNITNKKYSTGESLGIIEFQIRF